MMWIALKMLFGNRGGLPLNRFRPGGTMTWIAFKMLTGNRSKYLGILAGVTFAALLIAQQASTTPLWSVPRGMWCSGRWPTFVSPLRSNVVAEPIVGGLHHRYRRHVA